MREQDALSLTLSEWQAVMEEMGEQKYRASQIFSWLHQKCAADWQEMSDLPAALRESLQERYGAFLPRTEKLLTSALDGTKKALFALADGNLIESVLMRYRFGNSVCVSSQAGCQMGCAFCASTIGGLKRSLTAGEMLGQVYALEKELPQGERVGHIVVMGSGEPMENYEEVIRFFRLLSDEKGRHISLRSMTVSTCGIVPGILRLSGEGIPVNLAVSLHAPNDEIRRRIMPIAKKYGIDEILGACRNYFDSTGRRLTWEYALIRGVNDREEDAAELAERLKGIDGVVNLIPMNPVRRENALEETDARTVRHFQEILTSRGQDTTIRRTLGRDIDGACGQLRHRYEQA